MKWTDPLNSYSRGTNKIHDIFSRSKDHIQEENVNTFHKSVGMTRKRSQIGQTQRRYAGHANALGREHSVHRTMRLANPTKHLNTHTSAVKSTRQME